GFSSFAGVCKAKAEMYAFLKQSGGVAFYDSMNQNLVQMISEHLGLRKTAYNTNEFRGEFNKQGELTVSIKGKNKKINTKLTGSYNTANIAAAYTVTAAFGVDYLTFVDAIESYSPNNNRSQLVYNGSNIIIADAYNANPTSMDIAIKNLKHFNKPNMVVILGAMKELGADTQKEHLKVLNNVKKMGVTQAHFIGGEYADVKIEAENMNYYDSTEEYLEKMVSGVFENAVILVKGSRSMELEKVLNKYM
ncbi:MAG: cyanophycin synthetase, partial [Rikenellaceae bacterium]